MVHIVVAGYIVDHYCLRFDRGVVHIVAAGYIVDHYCLMFDRGVVHIVAAGYILDHYCLGNFVFDRRFRTSVSVLVQKAAFAIDVPSDIYAFHRYTDT